MRAYATRAHTRCSNVLRIAPMRIERISAEHCGRRIVTFMRAVCCNDGAQFTTILVCNMNHCAVHFCSTKSLACVCVSVCECVDMVELKTDAGTLARKRRQVQTAAADLIPRTDD